MAAKICSFLKSLISVCWDKEPQPPTSDAMLSKSQEIIAATAAETTSPRKREKLSISLVPVKNEGFELQIREHHAKMVEIRKSASCNRVEENSPLLIPETPEPMSDYERAFRNEMPDWELGGKHHVTSYTSPKDSAFLKSLPIKDLDGFNTLIGSDFESIKMQRLIDSELGKFVQRLEFEIIRFLPTSGFNSYCFEIQRATTPRFLKVFKLKEWDFPSLKSCIYSLEYGVGCLVNNTQGLRSVVIPERVIGLNSQGALTDKCVEGNLILATISPLFDQENLRNVMRRGRLDASSVFKLIENILVAVASFKRHKITHRDLTPANILVDPKTLAVAITDFDHATTQICRPLDGPFAARESSSKIDEFTLGLVFLELHLGLNPCDRLTGLEGTVRDLIYNGKIPLLKNESLIDLVIRGLLDMHSETRWTVFEALDCLQKRI